MYLAACTGRALLEVASLAHFVHGIFFLHLILLGATLRVPCKSDCSLLFVQLHTRLVRALCREVAIAPLVSLSALMHET